MDRAYATVPMPTEPPSSTPSATSPTTIVLLTVPKPGRCRSGIQASSTVPLTPITTQPIGTPRCLAMP